MQYWRYESEIDRLEKAMNGFQSVMDSGLLSRLCTSSDANAILLREGFSGLEKNLQSFVQDCARGQKDLSALISKGNDSTKQHVSKEMAKASERVSDKIQNLNL